MSPVRTDVALGLDHMRDLGAFELWERSLKRSRHRRRIAEIDRRSRRRRKGTSVAVSAALAAGPVLPTATAIADSGPGGSSSGQLDPGAHDALAGSASHVVLRYGSTGRLVAAAQMRLNSVVPLHHLVVDGIYGPLTRAAVEDFQSRQDLGSSGRIDTRTWADLFNAPVLTLADGGPGASGDSGTATEVSTRSAPADTQPASTPASSVHAAAASASAKPARTSQSGSNGSTSSGSGASQSTSGSSSGSGNGGGGTNSVAVVTPSKPSSQSVSYVLSNGVALPLPRGYLTGGSVDQGVDYAAPGGTPLYAMGDGVIIGAGISGFGPNAPILKITSGPLKGMEIYYGHAGGNSVHVGQHVRAGQQISQVGYGIVGISTGPHLEVGFYPPGAMGAGSRMLSLINSLLGQHSSGRAWGTKMAKASTVKTAVDRASTARSTSTHASTVRVSDTSSPTAPSSTPARAASTGSSSGGAPSPSPSATTPDAQTAPAASAAPSASAAPADTASARADTSSAPADTGSSSAPADTGSSSAPADTGSNGAPADTGGSGAPADTGSSSAPADTGSSSAPADTGSSSAPADTSSNAPADTSNAPAQSSTPASASPPSSDSSSSDSSAAASPARSDSSASTGSSDPTSASAAPTSTSNDGSGGSGDPSAQGDAPTGSSDTTASSTDTSTTSSSTDASPSSSSTDTSTSTSTTASSAAQGG